MSFDSFLILDWSASADTGPSPRKDAVWTCVARVHEVEAPLYHRSPAAAEAWLHEFLTAELAAGRRCLAGFDFAFGYPAGSARVVTGSDDPRVLWDWLDEALRGQGRFDVAGRLNGLFPGVGPFWFNGLARDVPDLPRKGRDREMAIVGLPEKRAAEMRAPGSFSPWQMGGAGAVGSQAMTGMALLSRLKRAFGDAVSVWPFEPTDRPLALVEVWPSLLAEPVREAMKEGPDRIKDAAQVRVLAGALAEAQRAGTLEPMLADVPEGPSRVEEGWILGIGHEAALASAARAARRPDLQPPRLKNDCFAMPQGVDWTPVDVALARLREGLTPVVGTEDLAVAEAAGRVLAANVTALRSNPPGPNTAVDGYGMAASVLSKGRQVLPLAPGRAAAGAPFTGRLPEGQALRVLTGALLPEGVDTVVLEEDVTVGEGHIAFDGGLKRGANTRKAGEDVAAGDIVLPKGRVLSAPDLALLSASGNARVPVFARLRVGVLSTGDELAAPGSTLDLDRTYDANRPMLLALAARWGYQPVDLGHVGDDRAALAARFDEAAQRADVLLTSGGASAGDEDHVSALLRDSGGLQTWRIALKPGRPLALALWKGMPVFGLPGNPVAAFVCTLIFARPSFARLSGADWADPLAFEVPAAFEKRKKPGRREYLRARLTPDGRAEVFKSEGSGRISGLSWAEGLVELEDAERHVRPGDPVRYLPYGGFGL